MKFIREKGIWTAVTTWKGKLVVAPFTYLEMAIQWAYWSKQVKK